MHRDWYPGSTCGARSDQADDLRGVAPQPLEAVELALLGGEQVDDHGAIVEEHPASGAAALHANGTDPLVAQLVDDPVCQRLELTVAAASAIGCIVISDPSAPSIQIRGLIRIPNSSTADGRPALVTALIERFPDKEFYLPAIFPEETGEAACAPLGFVREKLHQFLMRKDFAESPTLDG